MSEYRSPESVPETEPVPPPDGTPAGFDWVPAFLVIVSVIVLIIGVVGVGFGLANFATPEPIAELSSGASNEAANLYSAIAFAGICVAPGIMGTIIGAYLWSRQRQANRAP